MKAIQIADASGIEVRGGRAVRGATMRSLLALAGAVGLLACAGCTDQDLERAREAVRLRLRDPASAVFKDEKIRTIWSANGDRLKLYCAEVNARNGFGGLVGFKPVEFVIDVTSTSPTPGVAKRGDVWFNEPDSPSYYLHCQRADTERANGTVFLSTPNLFASPGDMRHELDRDVPILSLASAPN